MQQRRVSVSATFTAALQRGWIFTSLIRSILNIESTTTAITTGQPAIVWNNETEDDINLSPAGCQPSTAVTSAAFCVCQSDCFCRSASDRHHKSTLYLFCFVFFFIGCQSAVLKCIYKSWMVEPKEQRYSRMEKQSISERHIYILCVKTAPLFN